MSWDDLPPGVQRKILSYVPLSTRLRTCSLVNMTMCEAAAAATQQLHLELNERAGRDESLEKWLTKHSQYVTSLQLANATVLLQPPCPHLQQLHLHSCVVPLARLLEPSSSYTQGTRLTKLVLSDCFFSDNVDMLTGALTVMSNLQHLALVNPRKDEERRAWPRLGPGPDLPSKVLQHLTQLTYLSLRCSQRYCHTTAPTLQHVSTLQHLQELCLEGAYWPGSHFSLSVSPSTTPGITCLTALTRLELKLAVLNVAVLQPLTQLRTLLLQSPVLPVVCDMAALLQYISQLVLLQDLQFMCAAQGPEPAPEAYAALTASSNLQDLEVALIYKAEAVGQQKFGTAGLPASEWPAAADPAQAGAWPKVCTRRSTEIIQMVGRRG